jgi:hypothetical protein
VSEPIDNDLEARLIEAIRLSGNLHEQCTAEVLAADETGQPRLLAEWDTRLTAADANMRTLLDRWAEQRRNALAAAVPSPWEYAARYFEPPGNPAPCTIEELHRELLGPSGERPEDD